MRSQSDMLGLVFEHRDFEGTWFNPQQHSINVINGDFFPPVTRQSLGNQVQMKESNLCWGESKNCKTRRSLHLLSQAIGKLESSGNV